jgi:hypothetical protein
MINMQTSDWAWGVSLIVLMMVIHVFGLVLISQRAIRAPSRTVQWRRRTAVTVAVMGYAALLVTLLHGIEACIWAAAYLMLGALPNPRSAALYSLNAVTTYGHESLILQGHWQLLGALEALNGCLAFGLTTAFLFAIVQKVVLGSLESS